MGLAWFRKPTVSVEVLGAEIIVRMPGTRFSVVFEKTDDNQLIASSFSAFSVFLLLAARPLLSSCFLSFIPEHEKAGAEADAPVRTLNWRSSLAIARWLYLPR